MGGRSPTLPELEYLAAAAGDFVCYWGFKKIHGRIWTHLYLSPEPLDARQLMARLKVSKALISLSLNDLLRYRVILEAPKSSRGTQTYAADLDVLGVILNTLRRRERKMLAEAGRRHRSLSEIAPPTQAGFGVDPERVHALGVIIQTAQNALASLLELTTVDFTSWDQMNQGEKSGRSSPPEI